MCAKVCEIVQFHVFYPYTSLVFAKIHLISTKKDVQTVKLELATLGLRNHRHTTEVLVRFDILIDI